MFMGDKINCKLIDMSSILIIILYSNRLMVRHGSSKATIEVQIFIRMKNKVIIA